MNIILNNHKEINEENNKLKEDIESTITEKNFLNEQNEKLRN